MIAIVLYLLPILAANAEPPLSQSAFQFYTSDESLQIHEHSLHSCMYRMRWRGDSVAPQDEARTIKLHSKTGVVEELEATEQLLAEIILGKDEKQRFRVAVSDFPSADPHFRFYQVDGEKDEPFATNTISGYELTILDPAEGIVEVSGHTNNMSDQHKLYRISSQGIQEIGQPYLYAGLKSKTKKPLDVFTDETLQHSIGVIPAETPVYVVLANNAEDKYLLLFDSKTLGWVTFRETDQADNTLEGIYFKGD